MNKREIAIQETQALIEAIKAEPGHKLSTILPLLEESCEKIPTFGDDLAGKVGLAVYVQSLAIRIADELRPRPKLAPGGFAIPIKREFCIPDNPGGQINDYEQRPNKSPKEA